MRIIHQDITQATETVIVHGCNAMGKYNSGVAKSIRMKWPYAYRNYMAVYKSIGLKLGQIICSTDGNVMSEKPMIYDLISQESYGYNRVYASVPAIAGGLYEICAELVDGTYGTDPVQIAIPMIGCGRGGLSWDTDVRPIISMLENLFCVEFIVYNNEGKLA